MCCQLRVVFNSCESDTEGRISLCDLANLSRSHCGGAGEVGLVDQLLDIFQCGEEEEDRVTFPQFCDKMVGYINLNNPGMEQEEEERDEFADSYSEVNVKTLVKTETVARPSSPFSPGLSDQGAFNENLKRSFEKTRSAARVTSSPNRVQVRVLTSHWSRSNEARLSLVVRITVLLDGKLMP